MARERMRPRPRPRGKGERWNDRRKGRWRWCVFKGERGGNAIQFSLTLSHSAWQTKHFIFTHTKQGFSIMMGTRRFYTWLFTWLIFPLLAFKSWWNESIDRYFLPYCDICISDCTCRIIEKEENVGRGLVSVNSLLTGFWDVGCTL